MPRPGAGLPDNIGGGTVRPGGEEAADPRAGHGSTVLVAAVDEWL
ncbi:hypothetical protein [Streptomyces sp. NPDC057238]